MNRIGLYVSGLFLSVIWMTSCMKGSNVSEGIACGVVGTSSKNYSIVLKTSWEDLYSTTINSTGLFEGDCCIFQYRYDADSPENSPSAIAANGYYTISILNIDKVQKYYLSPVNNISTILPNEVPLMRGYDYGDFIENHLFITHLVNQPSDMELNWTLSGDESTMPTIDGDSRRYYDLYIRATVKKEGDNVKTDKYYTIAYYMYNYLSAAASKEKSLLGNSYSASSSNFTLRFNYVSALDEETNTITWQSDSQDVPIAYFLLE